jgi:hypothetical protein
MAMSNSIHSIQDANRQIQKEQTIQPPKREQQKTNTAAPQDKVVISESAKQALTNNS